MIDIKELKFDDKGLIPAIVVDATSKKVLTLIFTLSKKKVYYEPELVFGSYRKSQLQAA